MYAQNFADKDLWAMSKGKFLMSDKTSKLNHTARPVAHGDHATTIAQTRCAEPEISHEDYKFELNELQIEFVKLQRHLISQRDRILVVLEGRDSAGKDGSIKRIVAHLSPRETRVVALGKPSDRDTRAWYFERYVAFLPVTEEMVLFNRSWYNRAGVERVMGFCTKSELKEFMQSVPRFEQMLVDSGIKLLKYYLDISKNEQKKRLDERRKDPLKQWKISPIDTVAVKHWDDYSAARNAMLLGSHTVAAPWQIVRADNKRRARLNLMRDILSRLHYAGRSKKLKVPDRNVVFEFTPECLVMQRLAP
jgi:polyphosphate kinase 2